MTDHKAEAERLYDYGWHSNTNEAVSVNALAAGQIQATLYLAEQQRIANLIAFLPFMPSTGREDDPRQTLREHIRTELGL